MEFVSTTKAAFLLDVSVQRLRQLLAKDRIEGAYKEKRSWHIPLFEGMPKVIEGSRGPQGRWRKSPQKVSTVIHVNQEQIRANQGETHKPMIAVQQGNKTTFCDTVDIPGVGRFIYQPNNTESSDAEVYLELNPDIVFKTYRF